TLGERRAAGSSQGDEQEGRDFRLYRRDRRLVEQCRGGRVSGEGGGNRRPAHGVGSIAADSTEKRLVAPSSWLGRSRSDRCRASGIRRVQSFRTGWVGTK